ncbi:neuronal PAS domain-containing protein 4-like [Pleurodeles waltl]
MTVCCRQCPGAPAERCQRPANRRHPQRSALDRPFRSTKSASKARRDHMNAEIRALRELLPLPGGQRGRLSYLHTMALVCLRMRGRRLSAGASEGLGGSRPPPPGLDPLPALPGFIIALSAQGQLLSITDNVVDYLGYSMVELLAQGDSFFHLIHASEAQEVQRKLREAEGAPGSETSFVCHLQSEKVMRLQHGGDRAVLVRGRFLPSTAPATFLALCTPLELGSEEAWLTHSASFRSQHTLDMRLTEVTDSVFHHLGYQPRQLIGRSWYSLLHPEDLNLGVSRHQELLRGDGSGEVKFAVRMLTEGLTHVWVQVTATRERHGQTIGCINRILSAEEACYLGQDQTCAIRRTTTGSPMEGGQQSRPGVLSAEQSSHPYNRRTLPGTPKRKAASRDQESKRARARQTTSSVSSRASSLEVQKADPCLDTACAFTPPYTPESDTSSLSGLTSSDSPSSDTGPLTAESWDLPSEHSPHMDSRQVLGEHWPPVRTTAAADRLEAMVDPSLAKEDWDLGGSIAFFSPHLRALVPDSLMSPNEEDTLVAEADFYPSSAGEHEGFYPSSAGEHEAFYPSSAGEHEGFYPSSAGEHVAFLSPPEDHGLPGPSPYEVFQEVSAERRVDISRASPPSSGRPQYMDHEWQEISLLASQLRSMAESFSVYSRPAHHGLQERASVGGWRAPKGRHHGEVQDPALDESAISSILMDLCAEVETLSAPVERGGSCTGSLHTPEAFTMEAKCPEGPRLRDARSALEESMTAPSCAPEMYLLKDGLQVEVPHGGEESMF